MVRENVLHDKFQIKATFDARAMTLNHHIEAGQFTVFQTNLTVQIPSRCNCYTSRFLPIKRSGSRGYARSY